MIPVFEGVIARRVLLNYRADPAVIRRMVPAALEVVTHNEAAVVGVCLIRLERLRVKGSPALFAMASENMAQRVAVRYRTANGWREGVFIWRRETDRRVIALFGGRLFPGVHQAADFRVVDTGRLIVFDVRTAGGTADVSLVAERVIEWEPKGLFGSLGEASEFFRRGDCGLSCALDGRSLEGMQLRTLRWEVEPLRVVESRAVFYEQFPPGSIELDSALLMRGLPHEWHALPEVPDLGSPQEIHIEVGR